MPRTSSGSAPDVIKGAVAGLVAGLAATWVMTQFQTHVTPETLEQLLGEEEDTAYWRQGDSEGSENQNGEEESTPATVEAAERISEFILNREIPDGQEQLVGQIVHYGFGTSAGAAYGMVAESVPQVTAGLGLPFGAAFWLMADEVGVSAAGLSEPPWEHPPSTHLYGLTAHLVYGFTLELSRRLVRSIL